MSAKLVVGIDGSDGGERALKHAMTLAKLVGDCTLVLVCVIEWSPYSFNTPEENEKRHKRREKEISTAKKRVLEPASKLVTKNKLEHELIVHHGDAADILNDIAKKQKAKQIIVARKSEGGLRARIFGSVAGSLIQSAAVPVTIVP